MRPLLFTLMMLLSAQHAFSARSVLAAEQDSAAAGASTEASALSSGMDDSGLQVGDDAPAFSLRAYNEEASLKLVKSPFVSLNHFVGLGAEYPKKVMLVGFFAMWNEKSRKDLAVFQRIFKKFKDDELALVMISVDHKDTQTVYEAIEKEKLTFPVLRDRFSVVFRRYGVKTLPTLFLIDKDGKLVSIGDGYKESVEEYLEREIKRLLAES